MSLITTEPWSTRTGRYTIEYGAGTAATHGRVRVTLWLDEIHGKFFELEPDAFREFARQAQVVANELA